MKRLFLVRHAKSSWAQPGLSDHARPLADRGMRDAARIFDRLHRHGPRFEQIVTSDAKRTLATTECLVEAVGLSAAAVREEPRLYHASAGRILAIVQEQPTRCSTIACVGHNPGFTDTVNALAANFEIDNMPTCAVAGLEFEVDDWADIRPGGGRLVYWDYPKNLGHPILEA